MANDMRKEFGKWLMDIAKYITTAVILSSVFGQVSEAWIIYAGGAFTVLVTLSWGLFLLKPPSKEKKD